MTLQITRRTISSERFFWLSIGLIACWLLAASFAYQLALPGRKLSFPADHYSHPDFKTEWWYYTGHLETDGGKRYGYQVTFFRFGVRDRQKEAKDRPLFTELYMAHFALSDITGKKFLFRERINRGIAGKAGGRGDGSLPRLERGLESRRR